MQAASASMKDLFKAILALRDLDECERFMTDLCTPAELQSLADRWRVAQLLERGVSYRAIYEKTGVSTATVTRVARALTYGEDGYKIMLERMGKTAKNAQ